MSNDQNDPTAHPPLPLQVAERLLDLLSTDDAFRALFVADPHQALLQVGLTPEAADAALVGSTCMRPETLASKEDLANAREKLLESMVSVTAHTVPFCLLT